jgi:hypothetical protein
MMYRVNKHSGITVLVRGLICLVYSDNERDPGVPTRGGSPARPARGLLAAA